MSVTLEQARRIAELARLRIPDAELERLTGDLNGILEHIDALQDAALAQGAELTPPGRERLASVRSAEPAPPGALERDLGDFAPEVIEGFLRVPPLPGFDE